MKDPECATKWQLQLGDPLKYPVLTLVLTPKGGRAPAGLIIIIIMKINKRKSRPSGQPDIPPSRTTHNSSRFVPLLHHIFPSSHCPYTLHLHYFPRSFRHVLGAGKCLSSHIRASLSLINCSWLTTAPCRPANLLSTINRRCL